MIELMLIALSGWIVLAVVVLFIFLLPAIAIVMIGAVVTVLGWQVLAAVLPMM